MHTYLSRMNNYYNSYNYQPMVRYNETTGGIGDCESIFIYTCEPAETTNTVSFKGGVPKISTKFITAAVLPTVTAAVATVASLFKKKNKTEEADNDVKRIIQNQKDMEYICALKRDFVPHTEFEQTVLENYNKNLSMLEAVNKALISKIVDDILSKKKFKDLPEDYPQRIKDWAYCASTWGGDCFTLKENDVEYYISKLREEDAEKAAKTPEPEEPEKELTSQETDTSKQKSNEYFTIRPVPNWLPVSKMSVEDLTQTEKQDSENTEEDAKTIDEITKRFQSGKIDAREAGTQMLKLLKEALEEAKIDANCKDCSDKNTHEGIIDIIE